MRSEKLERGVYVAPYLVGDDEVLIAVDSRHRARKHLKLNGVTEERATKALRLFLDRIDPLPKLELVRGPAEPIRRTEYRPPAPIHPAHYDDPRNYRRRLAAAAAARIHIFRA